MLLSSKFIVLFVLHCTFTFVANKRQHVSTSRLSIVLAYRQ